MQGDKISVIDCGFNEWLGVFERKGIEVYRSIRHFKGRLLAVNDVLEWVDKNGYEA